MAVVPTGTTANTRTPCRTSMHKVEKRNARSAPFARLPPPCLFRRAATDQLCAEPGTGITAPAIKPAWTASTGRSDSLLGCEGRRGEAWIGAVLPGRLRGNCASPAKVVGLTKAGASGLMGQDGYRVVFYAANSLASVAAPRLSMAHPAAITVIDGFRFADEVDVVPWCRDPHRPLATRLRPCGYSPSRAGIEAPA